jgi:hypothetical protein
MEPLQAMKEWHKLKPDLTRKNHIACRNETDNL